MCVCSVLWMLLFYSKRNWKEHKKKNCSFIKKKKSILNVIYAKCQNGFDLVSKYNREVT